MGIKSAVRYHENHEGLAIIIYKNGAKLIEQYRLGQTPSSVHNLRSGTKSFSGVIAQYMINDGYLPSFDMTVATHVVDWQTASAQKQACTLRNLLYLQSGLNAGFNAVNYQYQVSIDANIPANDVGQFKYGPHPFGVAGHFFKTRLLDGTGYTDPVDYLTRRILTPAGISVGPNWQQAADGNYNMAAGCQMTCDDWAKFGMLCMANHRNVMHDLVIPSFFFGYGICWWRAYDNIEEMINGTGDSTKILPHGGYCAAGAQNQRLLVFPEIGVVVARHGREDPTWNDTTFVTRLLN